MAQKRDKNGRFAASGESGFAGTKRVAKADGKSVGIRTMRSAWGVTKGTKNSNKVVGVTKRQKMADSGSYGGQQSINGARQQIATTRKGNKRGRNR